MNKTAFADTASDKLSRANAREEDLFDLFIEDESDLREGPYMGFIVEATKVNNKIKAYIRIPEIHDHILPIPCDKTYNTQQNKALKSMLLVALQRSDTHVENTDEEEVDYKGRQVEIRFLDGDPTSNGKMRGATISFVSETIHKDAQYCYLKDDGSVTATNLNFANGSGKFLGTEISKKSPPTSTGVAPETLSRNLIPEIASLISSGTARLLLFGDSQTNGWIGRHIIKYFSGKGAGGVKRMKTVYEKQGKHSQQPVYYHDGTGWNSIKPYLEIGAELVIMTLGGNGIYTAKKMIQKVKKANKVSNAVYIWIGPPPPAKDGKTYKYNEKVYYQLENKNVPRHKQRKGYADYLQKEISGEVTHYINPNNIAGFEDSYSCGGKCDGVHTPNKIAKTLLINAGIIEN